MTRLTAWWRAFVARHIIADEHDLWPSRFIDAKEGTNNG